MGCSQSVDDKEKRQRNDEIDAALKKEKASLKNEVKMLLLGAGESGKSTILKQMKLIHDNGYNNDEREAFKEIIFSNTVQSMRVILEAMQNMGIQLGNPANEKHKAIILDMPNQIEADVFPPECAVAVKALWVDDGVKECFGRSREYQLNDSASYYFDAVERIGAPDYLPTDQDVLRSRVKTTGITETTFHIGELTYRLFDVGGQRSERKKWIHCFENVTSIVFLVAISEYDQVLVEDETVTSIILFLNKIDLFKIKLQKLQWRNTSPISQSDQKQIYTHFTCATDTSQIKFVMAAVNDIIIQANLRDCGLM
ncbi:guanine nucleotide binding protein, alpha subunit [Chytridium lagenaria]|nr:guanine nucleotide binding protein, alpha subunit [Chytridium lagenaria]